MLLALGSRLLRQRQLTAEFVVLLLQTGPFLFKSTAPRVFFTASRLRGIPLRLGLHRFRFHDLASLVRRHLLMARFDLLSLCTLMLQGGPNLLQFRSISKNARSQFLALLLLLFERFAQSGSLSRHGLELLLQLFVGPRLRGIGFPNCRCRSRRSCESPRQVINALLAGHHRLGRHHFLQLLFQPLSLLTLLFQSGSDPVQFRPTGQGARR